jgi:hypothetical protein
MARRKLVSVGHLMIFLPFLFGMGMFGQPAAREEVPFTEERFDATVEDLEGVVVDLTHVSYDGELYLPVYRGMGLVTIPFGKIRSFEVGEKQKSRREVTVSFRDETRETFWVDEDLLFLGKVSYGTYQIQAKDILRLEFVQTPSE